MSAQLTAIASETGAHTVAETVASLPVSFAPAQGIAVADVVEISGEDAWPQAVSAAIAGGARGVVVTDPGWASAEAVRALAAAAAQKRVPVVLAEPFSSNAALDEASDAIRDVAHATTAISVRLNAVGVTDRQLALYAVRALRACGVAGFVARTITAGRQGVIIDGVAPGAADGALVTILGSRSPAAEQSVVVRLYAPERMLEVALPSPASARPASVLLTDESGSRLFPTLYETANRTAWRRLHAAVSTGTVATEGLLSFAADLEDLASTL